MTDQVALESSVTYSGSARSVRWEGRVVDDPDRFARYLQQVVKCRISDDASSFEADLRGLSGVGLGPRAVDRMLDTVPEPEGSAIGEALAECALRDDAGRTVRWPWNMVRDRRSARASLQGPDLIGFVIEKDRVSLLVGEVKTSSERRSPPTVMRNHDGMAQQIERCATDPEVHLTMLQWLHVRCRTPPWREFYEKAVQRFLGSGGRDLIVVGILNRDSAPSGRDLEATGKRLSKQIETPTRVQLIAWYLPVRIADWPRLLRDQTQ